MIKPEACWVAWTAMKMKKTRRPGGCTFFSDPSDSNNTKDWVTEIENSCCSYPNDPCLGYSYNGKPIQDFSKPSDPEISRDTLSIVTYDTIVMHEWCNAKAIPNGS